jgi:SAM-dependent methyltransferase
MPLPCEFCHPLDHRALKWGTDGHLYDADGRLAFKGDHGSYDFVTEPQGEREYHENLYATGGWWAGQESLDTLDLDQLWQQEPGCAEYLKSLGEVNGKSILLFGNGTSIKEFLFIKRGAFVVFTDLSINGVLYARRRYLESQIAINHPGACEFHAVDAYHLPFAPETFDLVCADGVIHHLENLSKLLSEIHRCLKPQGKCRFLDTGYSSAWQWAKKTILHSLQARVHRRSGISPADRKATDRGGYTRIELEQLKDEVGFRSLCYKRVALFDYLLWRARCKLDLPSLLRFRPAIQWLDRRIVHTRLMQSQGLSLICGFDK